MLRQFFSSRWMGYLALTVVFSVVASFFGLWQWDRREQAVAAMELVEANWDATPLTVTEFRARHLQASEAEQWTPIVLEGRYVPEDQLLVRTRPRAGVVGFEVLVPFEADTATVLLSRGWVATGESTDFPDLVPPPPLGEVTVMGRVKMWEPTLRGRGAPDGQVASINIEDVQAQVSSSLAEDFYLVVDRETPKPAVTPLGAQRPVLDEGPHLSYTFQWFLFALMAFIGYGWLFRQEWRAKKGISAPREKKITDAEEEDALLERSSS
ncbi:SURF1 family protein [Pontimonas sp.]|nr:SURF1 family protein [Pontimonas sp.]